MSLRGSEAVVEQLIGIYSEEVVLDQLGWLYEEQIWRVAAEVSTLLPGYRQTVDEATYAREIETFFKLLDLAQEDFLSVQELETVLKRLSEQRRVFADAAHVDAPTRQLNGEDR
jgi:hypothetical protein